MSIQSRVVQVAKSLVGVEAGNPATHARFVEVLGIPSVGQSWEPILTQPFSLTTYPDGRFVTTGVSTCALVARGILRKAGVLDPSFELPYVQASGLSSLVDLARRHGALHQGGSRMPQPGDVLIVNNGGHVATVVEDQGSSFRTVDGGLVGARGLQAINIREGSVRSKSLVPSWIVIDTSRLPHRKTSDLGEWLVAAGLVAGAGFLARRLLRRGFRRNGAERAAERCVSCRGAAHAATGMSVGRGKILCGPCTREFWAWFRRHQQNDLFRLSSATPHEFVSFYEHALKLGPGRVYSKKKARRNQEAA